MSRASRMSQSVISEEEERAVDWRDDKNQYVNPFAIKEVKQLDFYRAIIAEFLATQFFVCGSILGVLSAQINFVNHPVAILLSIVVYHFFLILIVIYGFSSLSGAHFNPAVTTGLLFTRRVTIIRAIGYVGAQLAGGISGAAWVKAAVPGALAGTLSTPTLAAGVSIGQGIVMELIVTFGFVFTIFGTSFDPRGRGHLGPFAIAVVLALNIFAASYVTGGIMNPARAFGPAVVSGVWTYQYVFWIGEMIGGITGACVYQYVFMTRTRGRVPVPSTAGDNHLFIHFRDKTLAVDLQDVPA